MIRGHPIATRTEPLVPDSTLFRAADHGWRRAEQGGRRAVGARGAANARTGAGGGRGPTAGGPGDRRNPVRRSGAGISTRKGGAVSLSYKEIAEILKDRKSTRLNSSH